MAGGGGARARAYAAGGLTSQPILARVDTLRAEILREYDARESAINPFIGRAFEDAEAGALRVMTIGINAYLNSADWQNQKPGWFAAWFDEGKHPFDRAVARDASTVASSLVADSRLFPGLAFRGKASIFHTNAIKTYLPEAIGKRSDQISPQRYVGHRATWHAEFEIMARHGVLPHVVIVFGRPFWEWAWQAFHRQYRPASTGITVRRFTPASGDGLHYANLVDLEGAGGSHPLALLGVRHPSARATSKASPEWLLSLPDVRRLLGMHPEKTVV